VTRRTVAGGPAFDYARPVRQPGAPLAPASPRGAWAWTPRGTLALLLLWGAGHALLRLALSSSLTADDAREAVLAQSLEWGYQARQPPLYNWLVWGAFRLLGPGLLALTVLKYGVLVLAFWLVHLIARRVLVDPCLRTLAAFAFLPVVPISWTIHEALTHSIAVLAACAGTAYALLRVAERPTPGAFALLGLAMGAGALAKFTYPLFLAALLVAALSLAPFRQRLLRPALLVAVAVAAVVVLPVAAWYASRAHDLGGLYAAEVRIRGDRPWLAEATGGLVYLARVTAAYLGPLALVFLAVAPAVYRTAPPAPAHAPGRLLGRLLAAVLGLLAVLALGGWLAYLKLRWLIPAFCLAPLYLLWRLERQGATRRRVAALVLALVVAEVGLAAGLVVRVRAAGLFPRHFRMNEPYDRIAAELAAAGFREGTVVAGVGSLAGNLAVRFPGTRVLHAEYPEYRPPGRAGRGQCLLAWEPRGARPDAPARVPREVRALARRLDVVLTGVEAVRTIDAPFRWSARHVRRVDFVLLPDGAGRCR
jgi:4-amino-4-deoxy-L-arabinose transferase-like glycosyltransferase